MNQFNALNSEEPNEPPGYWDIQLTLTHFKSSTSHTKISPVVSDITGRLNHCSIDNVDVEFHPSYFPFEYNSEYVPIQTPL